MNENNVELRKIEECDTSNIIKWRNANFIKEQFIFRDDITIEMHRKWLSTVIATGKAVQFIIHLRDVNTDVGSVYLRDIDYIHKKAEFGIFIGEKNYLGLGIGSIVTNKIVKYAFNDLNLHKVYLRVLACNERAIASYSKSGFKKEGCLKDDVFCDGQFVDVMWMAIIQ